MSKIIDDTNLGYLISKIKAAFWPKSDVIQIDLDNTPTANSDNLVTSGGVKSALDTKQETLVSGTNIKTINNESLLGSGNISITGSSGGEANVIESITFNGTPATITNKTAAITATIPSTLDQIADGSTRKLSDYLPLAGGEMDDNAEIVIPTYYNGDIITSNTLSPAGVELINGGTEGYFGTTYLILQDTNKVVHLSAPVGLSLYDNLSDYDSGIGTYYKKDKITKKISNSGTYELTIPNKTGTLAVTSDIPSAVTESTVAGWGFTKNAGTLTSETDPIFTASTAASITSADVSAWNEKQDAISDLSDIRSGAALGATALQSYTETDPTVPSWAKASTKPTYTASEVGALPDTTPVPTESTVSGWGFTKNAGTVTGVKINGTTKTPTSGTVDLGTVLTSETALSKGTTTGNGNAVTDISVNGHQITLTKGTTFLTSETSLSKGTTTGSGNVVTDLSVSGHTITLTKGSTVPVATSANAGKIPRITSAGAWEYVTPAQIYSGSAAPNNSNGNNGDIYVQT